MAEYKVIQDIEAEDKIVGPFSLRQFVYAGIAAVFGYLTVISVTHNAGFLLAFWLPPMLFCMFFAWPWSPDQPTEVWALARIRFFLKPRRRIWDQSGVKDLVTITVPKKVEQTLTNGLSQNEVKSRLNALAETIDSRGWAIKNSNLSIPTLPAYDQNTSDRLVTSSFIPQPVSDIDIQADEDMLDAQNSPVAQQFDEMIRASAQAHRQKIMSQLTTQPAGAPQPSTQAQPPGDYWFLNQPAASNPIDPTNVTFANPTLVQPGATQPVAPVAATPTPSEEAFAEQLLEQQTSEQHEQTMHLKTINPVGAQPVAGATPPVTAPSDAAILNLANNDDLDVATLARQAKKARDQDKPDDEVVISLR